MADYTLLAAYAHLSQRAASQMVPEPVLPLTHSLACVLPCLRAIFLARRIVASLTRWLDRLKVALESSQTR